MAEHLMCSVLIDQELNPQYIHMNDKTLKILNLKSKSIVLNFGVMKKELTIKIDHHLKLNQIKLPAYLNENISIPQLPYDAFFTNNHLFLGPVIGFLVTPWDYKRNIQEMAQLRFLNYDKIKGLIYIFNSQTIDQSNRTITGYYYEPTTNQCVEGTFPYPCAIYNRSYARPSIISHFKEYIGENIFNYPYGNDNKYHFWLKTSTIPYIGEHLPHTRAYNGMESLVQMLTKYESVFLKPTSLSRGRGIFHIKRAENGYLLSNNTGENVHLKSLETLEAKIRTSIMENQPYIIQQEIPFSHYGKKIDFRVYIQKDGTKNWKFSGMETKVAKVGSVISNSSYREKVMPGEEALKEIYHLNEEQIKQKIVEITQLCIEILKVKEKDGFHLGDVAIDLLLDKDCKVWVLEVQPNYASETKAKRSIDERLVLPYILPTPFEYAKSLAGF